MEFIAGRPSAMAPEQSESSIKGFRVINFIVPHCV